jgi:hemoglobin-like flavoprotein
MDGWMDGLKQENHIAHKKASPLNSLLTDSTMSHVMDTWELMRRVKNYEQVAGAKLFQKLFNKCPAAKVLFGFPVDIDANSLEVLTSKRFLMHASYLISMIDTALNMLGPDIELLTDIMLELGVKHIRYGVTPEMFPIMGDCLIETLEETLGVDAISVAAKNAWLDTYDALAGDMIRAQKEHRRSSKA